MRWGRAGSGCAALRAFELLAVAVLVSAPLAVSAQETSDQGGGAALGETAQESEAPESSDAAASERPSNPPPPTSVSAEPPSESPAPRASRRIVGGGTGLGGGVFGVSLGDRAATAPMIVLLDLWIDVPLLDWLTLQAWIPIGPMVLFRLVSGNFAAVWGDVFAKMYVMDPEEGFFVAPGFGFWYLESGSANGVVVEIPARVGWEISSDGRGFGFEIAARGWLDVIVPLTGGDTEVGGGAVAELAFHFFATR